MKKKVEIEKIYPLSPMQEGMLFHALKDRGSTAYFEQNVMDINGHVDPGLLEESFNRLVQRYDIFRTVFRYENVRQPLQVVLKERRLHMHYEDIAQMETGAKNHYLEEFERQDREKGFDLTRDLLIRLSLFKIAAGHYRLIWDFHHILMDGWCLGILFRDLVLLYQSLLRGEEPHLEPVVQYGHYLRWLESRDKEKAGEYWKNYLAGYEAPAILPIPGPVDNTPGFQGERWGDYTLTLDHDCTRALDHLVREYRVTVNNLFQAVWGLLLQCFNNTSDVVFGAVVSGRPPGIEGVETMVGLFINTVPVRIQTGENQTFSHLLEKVQEQAGPSRAYEYLPLAEVQSFTPLRSNLIHHIMTFENYPVSEVVKQAEKDQFPDFTVTDARLREQTNYPFDISIMPREQIEIRFTFNETLYPGEFIRRTAGYFYNIITSIMENPDIPINRIDFLPPEEKNQLLEIFNDTAFDCPLHKTVCRLFAEQTARAPDHIALIWAHELRERGTVSLTYRELNERAERLAGRLKEKGVLADSIIGIMMHRSIEMIIGILGILKAGGAYLPIDPEYPRERIDYMLADSSAGFLLSEVSEVSEVSGGTEVIDLPSLIAANEDAEPTHLGYVIYTSGTTGRPKGVMVRHGNLTAYLLAFNRVFNIGPGDVMLQEAAFTFDAFCEEVFATLVSGGTLAMPGEGILKDIDRLLDFIERGNITIVDCSPLLMSEFSRRGLPRHVHTCIGGSDILKGHHIDRLLRAGKKVYNIYGPTETTMCATFYACTGVVPEDIPIGRPFANYRVYILDRGLRVQPRGIPGELFIGGAGVAVGYLNNPELTAEKFIGYRSYRTYGTYISKKIYKTGDLARWLADGNLEFLGRIDSQVKIRGFRIELGEIEKRLIEYPGVEEAVVMVRGDSQENHFLCAYIVTRPHDGEAVPRHSDLKKFLLQRLPVYMVPAVFVPVDDIPVTPAGKVDRSALPAPSAAGEARRYAAPGDEVEEKLAGIWAEILGIDRNAISIEDDFFHLGGHSLRAMILLSRVKKVFNVEVPLQQIFDQPTLRAFAHVIKHGDKHLYEAITPVEKREYYPLSSAQKRLLILDQFDHISTSYNMSTAVKIKGTPDRTRLEHAFQQMILRHESLRTAFPWVNDEPVQKIHDRPAFAIEYYPYRGDEKQKNIEQMIEDFIRPFDLSRPPLLRVGLAPLTDNEYLLMFDMHHTIGDGTTDSILLQELTCFYHGETLPPLTIQYKDFSTWQNHLFAAGLIDKQEAYWLNCYRDIDTLEGVNLPADHARPAVMTFEGNHYSFTIDDIRSFKALTGANGATLFMGLLTVFTIWLYKLTGQGDAAVGTAIAGRPHADLQQIIGMFVNTLVIRNHPHESKSFVQLLAEVKENCLRAYENQDLQFEELVERLNPERDSSRNPLFDVSLVLQNYEDHHIRVEDITFTPLEFENVTSKYDLTFFCIEMGTGLYFNVEYYSRIFERESIQRFVEQFRYILHQVENDPYRCAGDIRLLPEHEKERILREFNDTRTPYPFHLGIHELFAEQVTRVPDRIALVGADGGHLTYRALDEKANQLANYLLHGHGLRPETPVGLLLDRGIDAAAALAGILKAGGGYVPLDPDWPEKRLKTVVHDARIPILISGKRYIRILNRLQWECPSLHTFLCLDTVDVYGEEETEKSSFMDKKLWDYVAGTAVDDITAGGWLSSYTGQPFSRQEMDEYGGNILAKLMPLLDPAVRVLEIGCASGISMYRIAPRVGYYLGTDLSAVTIEKNRERVRREGHSNIALACLPAHEIDQIREQPFDLVIINSVIQAFHGHNYLRQVIARAAALLKNRGYLFIGDVMDLDLKDVLVGELETFKQQHKDKNHKTKTDWSAELFIPRQFFSDLVMEIPGFTGVEFSNKIYTVENELTRFRYDALFTRDKTGTAGRGRKNKYQEDLRALEPYDGTLPRVRVSPCQLAYVMYTSGSTGIPKGVMVEHRNVVRLVKNTNYVPFEPGDRILPTGALEFDASTFEVWGALANGLQLYPVPKHVLLDPVNLKLHLLKYDIGTLWMTAPFFNRMVDADVEIFQGLRYLLVGGDVLSPAHINRVREAYPQLTIINGYGPTENTTFSCTFRIDREYTGNIPIGSPIANSTAYIIDKHHQPVPIGVEGELVVGGDGVSRGYLNDPELTGEKFIEYRSYRTYRTYISKKLYKTGDLARWLRDGNIEFLGRIDTQVKIRGYRIEPGEVRNRLLRRPDIKDAAVIVPEEEKDAGLRAYVVLADGSKELPADLTEYLCRDLPEYMIPSHFIPIEKIPLAPTGKVDRKALPRPRDEYRYGEGDEVYTAPADEVERRLADIWSGILGIAAGNISTTADFFRLGGHSLRAATLVSRIHKEFDVKVPLAEVFRQPYIRELAGFLRVTGKDRFRRIEPSPEMDYYPQSSAQKRLFLLDRFENAGTGYNMPTVLRINGSFDKNRLELALKKLIHRHETLRTRFDLMGNEPVQIVQPPENVAFQIETMEIDAAEDQAREQIKTTLAGWIRPFDLRRAPLLRVGLVKLRGDVHFLLLDMHHIISDGTSLGIFFNECLRLYLGEELPPMRIRYKDFSSWQARNSHMIRPQEEYWLNRFKGEIPVLELPTDYPRPALMTFAGATHDFLLGAEETAALNHLAAREGVTLFMLLMAIFNVLLYKYTGRTDIVVGSGVAGRNHADLQDIIGMFVNMLPMRSQPEPHRRFPAFLRQVKQISLEALENQDVQFENLVEKINPLRDTSRNPIFDVTFVNQNYEVPAQELAGVTFAPVDLENRTSRFDLTLFAYETGSNIYFQLEYYVRIFKAQTIRRLAGHLQNLIIAVTADPDREIAYLPIISTEEKHRLLYDFNDTTAAFPKDKTIHQLFAEQVERTPNHIAVKEAHELHELHEITYCELNRRADRLAAFFTEKGVLADSIIGIMMEQSIGMIIGILGILKAGGAYLPIDPGYPQERIDYMLKDSGAKILLINLSEADLHHSSFITHNSGALAYVIYTSGSTGWPKGAAVSHRSLVNLCCWHNRCFGVTAFDRASKFAGPGFDASVWEIFPYLIMGASLCLVPEEIKTGVESLNRYFETHGITVSFLPTAVCEAFMELENRSLRVLLTGADKLKRFKKRAYRLVNNYGPTENTVVSTSFTVEREEANIPIGKPVFNQRVYILDALMRLQPIGAPGELCIAGAGLAAGYLNNPELTAEKFVFLYRSYRSYGSYRTYISKKTYKTGDLARWLGDGNIQFLGRMDQQVKIRGFRIEPGEIETRLLEHEAVKQAVVIARGEDANKYLCAYLVYEGSADNIQIPTAAELRQYLLRTLPDYMVPVFFVPLGHIPLTPNGKIDQKALPLPGITANDFCLPGTDMEEKLAVLWSGVLEIEKEKISIDADFFELGGHSLRAAVLVEGVQKTLNLTLPLVEVFKTPNIRGLARYLEAAAEPGTHGLQCLKKAPANAHLFFVHDGTGGVEMFIRLCGSLDISYNCWGIRARWLEGYAPQELTVERMAAGYIEGIREIQPKGPYRVVGFSIGGVLAFEVARGLIDSGQPVEFLGIIDALSPRYWQKEIEPFTVENELEFIRHQVLLPGMEVDKNMEQAHSLEELWEQVFQRLETYADAVPHILSLISRRGIPYSREGQGITVSLAEAICRLNILRTLTHALAFHKPTSITTNIHFFKAEESTSIDPGEWNAYFDVPIEMHHIPGDHFNFLQPPYVEQLARDLSDSLFTAARA